VVNGYVVNGKVTAMVNVEVSHIKAGLETPCPRVSALLAARDGPLFIKAIPHLLSMSQKRLLLPLK